MRYAAALEGGDWRGLPPVEKWNPERVGAIDIVIAADGTWFHEGAPIRRARLAKLFSTILRRDEDGYYLVTPAEKLKITVEDAPFVAVLMNAEGEGEDRRLTFTTNMSESVLAGAEHPLEMRATPQGEWAPYIKLRQGLDARIVRSVYYDLVAMAVRRHMKDRDVFGVWSGGVFFPLAGADD